MKIAITLSIIVIILTIVFLLWYKNKTKEVKQQTNNTNQLRKCESGYNTSSGFAGGFFYTDNKGACTP